MASLPALELAQIAAFGGRGTVAEGARQLGEVAAGVEFGLHVVGLGLGRGQFRRIVGLHATLFVTRGAGVPVETRISLSVHALRLRVLLLVLLVVALRLAGGELNLSAHLLAHHLLGDDAVADVGLEILERDALLLGRLFQVFHGCQVVLLADLVQPLDQLGFAGDAQFLALGEPELLVDEVAQQVLVGLGDLLHRGAVLARLVVQFLHGAVVVRARDDLVVDAGDDLLDRRAAVGALPARRDAQFAPERKLRAAPCENTKAAGVRKESKSHRVRARQAAQIPACSIDAIVNAWAAARRFRGDSGPNGGGSGRFSFELPRNNERGHGFQVSDQRPGSARPDSRTALRPGALGLSTAGPAEAHFAVTNASLLDYDH